LTANNFLPTVVANKEEVMQKIKELIPAGSSVTNGASKTLEQIGFIDYLNRVSILGTISMAQSHKKKTD